MVLWFIPVRNRPEAKYLSPNWSARDIFTTCMTRLLRLRKRYADITGTF